MKTNFTFLSALAGGLLLASSVSAQNQRTGVYVPAVNYNKTITLLNGVKLQLKGVDTTKNQGFKYESVNSYTLYLPDVTLDKTKTFDFDFIYPTNEIQQFGSTDITEVKFDPNNAASNGSQVATPDPCSKALDAVYALPATYSADKLLSFQLNFSPKDRTSGKAIIVEATKIARKLVSNCEDVVVSGTSNVSGSLVLNIKTITEIPIEIFMQEKLLRTAIAIEPISNESNTTVKIALVGKGAKVGVNNVEQNTAGFSDFAVDNSFAFPNPVEDVLYTTEKVEIYSLSGVKVSEGNGEINVSNLENGIYLVKGTSKITKIVKQ